MRRVRSAIVIGFSSSALAHRGWRIPDVDSYVYDSNYFTLIGGLPYGAEITACFQAAKAAYDPDRLFFGHNCVDREDRSADGFTHIR
jgi:hypothetical protein